MKCCETMNQMSGVWDECKTDSYDVSTVSLKFIITLITSSSCIRTYTIGFEFGVNIQCQ